MRMYIYILEGNRWLDIQLYIQTLATSIKTVQMHMQYCRGYIHALQSSSFYTIIPVYILQTHGIKVWKFY